MQLDRLDIMEQEDLRERTRALLVAYLGAEWVRTPGVMTLAREYFADMGEDNGGREETRARADDGGRETAARAETEGPETATREEMGAGKGDGTQVAIRAGGEMGMDDVAREKTGAGIEDDTGTRDGGWKDAGVRNEMGTRADDVAGIDDGTKTEDDARKDDTRGDDAGRRSAAGAGNDTKAAPNEMTLEGAHISIQKYFACVLLDLVLADPRLGNAPLEHARRLAGVLGIAPIFDGILKKEMIYPYDNHRQDIL
jgi:hypothetical protein